MESKFVFIAIFVNKATLSSSPTLYNLGKGIDLANAKGRHTK